jgi:predicted metalloprotease with PDZ domain
MTMQPQQQQQQGPLVKYHVSMEEPWTHCFRVRMTVSGLKGRATTGKVEFSMPVWTPGSYLVRDFARNILSIEAADGAGKLLAIEKGSKSRWVVSAGDSDSVVVTYRVYAFVFGTNTSYIDTDHAIINGASVFLYAEGFEKGAVSLEPYAPWKSVTTGLENAAATRWTFVAPNYDVLVDSPIEVGNQHVHSFEVGDTQYQVSIFAQKAVDEKTLVADLRKIVESTIPIYGEVPYKRYVFLIDFVADGYGGLEHLNSTHCIGSYFTLEPPEEYRSFLTLFSHEFFHAWNVKRMRPMALGPFDYSAENYTKSLWVAEGVTSYYEDQILRRAGIFSVPEFLEQLAEPISYVKSLPSSRVQTPEESSFDAWVRYYKQDENSPNVTPSYYRQGAVIGLLLDLQIRSSSANSRTLDYAMRTVYWETYMREGRGFTDEEFRRACGEASKGQTDEIFNKYVHGREQVDYDRYLGYAGLQLAPKTPPVASDGFLGIRVKGAPTLTVVTRLTGSPAEASDLSAGDEILATDGLRTDAQKLSFYIANRKPGTEVELTIARGGILRVVRTRLASKPVFEYRITKRQSASEAEKRTFASWALGDWDEPLVYKEHRPSPVAFRVFDYL